MVSIAENRDCMEAMREFPDNFFDLAVVDPPYGAGEMVNSDKSGGGIGNASADGLTPTVARTGGKWAAKFGKKIIAWDLAPGKDYFDELFRVSRNQIIWGGNYFSLPGSRCFLVWDKIGIPENFTMAMAEMAWTSFNANAKIFRFRPSGIRGRFHPTQKPVELYAWIFSRYAKPGDKILDTHLGSGSSRIAAKEAGLDFWGYEIDAEYFRKQEERFADHFSQTSLFW